jgi:monoamine oxidase
MYTVVLTAGKAAFEAENLSDDLLVTKITNLLSKIHGNGAISRPNRYIVTRWGKDRFSRGSHSCGDLQDRAILNKSVGGKLFFAGEATSKDPNTTEGAYRSALRVCGEVLDQFLGPLPRRWDNYPPL